MDTSIAILVILGVSFVFTLPSLLQGTDASERRAEVSPSARAVPLGGRAVSLGGRDRARRASRVCSGQGAAGAGVTGHGAGLAAPHTTNSLDTNMRKKASPSNSAKLKRLLALGFVGFLLGAVVTGVIAVMGVLSFAAPVLLLAASLACLTGVVVLNGLSAPIAEVATPQPVHSPAARAGARAAGGRAYAQDGAQTRDVAQPARAKAGATSVQPARAQVREVAQPVRAQVKTQAPVAAPSGVPARAKHVVRGVRQSGEDAPTSEIPIVGRIGNLSAVEPPRAVMDQPVVPVEAAAGAGVELHLGRAFEDASAGRGWFPKDIPAPTYVTAAQAEPRQRLQAVEVEQTSYGQSPASREELAHAFAAETRTRPEFEDAARVAVDSGVGAGAAGAGVGAGPVDAGDAAALRHGKTAIRADRNMANARAVVDDMLARRRA